ncbi:TVP38/TMEM64 family protein [Aquirufa echingensis]|uniref:TVP38/TMEM64 family membrane protein n=1 Tax=Aquirufa echingensis TaxID=3096516 RepID=A0ABW6CUH3_9BACT
MPKNRRIILETLYLLWMGALPVLSSVLLGYFALSNPTFFTEFSPTEYVLFWVSAVFIMGLALCPTTFFAMFTGFVWGWTGLWPLIIAYAIASLLGYFLARKMKGDALIELIRVKFKAGDFLANVQAQSFAWVFLARLSPIFPFAITNALMAFLGVPLRQFFVGGTLGMLPRTLIALWTGTQAASWANLLNHPEMLRWQDVASLGMLFISVIGMFVLVKRKA